MSNSRIYAKQEASEMALWELPFFGGDSQDIELSRADAVAITAEDVARIQEQAHQEAFEEGRKAGFEKGHAYGIIEGRELGHAEGLERGVEEARVAMKRQIEYFETLMQTLSTPLAELDKCVEEELVALAMAVARHLVRRELKTDPGHVIAAVRQAVSVLPIAARDVRVLLHPTDATLVRAAMSLTEHSSEEERRWRIVEDATLSRGGCFIETESSRVDATIESRVAAIVAKALGGERESDDGESA